MAIFMASRVACLQNKSPDPSFGNHYGRKNTGRPEVWVGPILATLATYPAVVRIYECSRRKDPTTSTSLVVKF